MPILVTMEEDVPTVLVTGASGYIATHIVQQLLQNGEYKVRKHMSFHSVKDKSYLDY